MWRSYSDHEVGHTFGQYHNFAGSTDALNYFDPYWALRQQNTMVVSASARASTARSSGDPDPNNPACPTRTAPRCPTRSVRCRADTALAPEWLQAPSLAVAG